MSAAHETGMDYVTEDGMILTEKRETKDAVMATIEEAEVLAEKEENGEGDQEDETRGKWSRQLDFFLSLVGFSVGLGNLWRFPYVCNRNGGGAFLIPFVFFVIVCGLPLFLMEVSLSQFSGRNSFKVWDFCPLFRGVGVGMNVISTITTIYYNTILAWCLYYFVNSFSAILPWTTCDNWWNTPHCNVRVGNDTSVHTSFQDVAQRNNAASHDVRLYSEANITAENSFNFWKNLSFAHTPAEEFWQYNTLRISGGFEMIGQVQWHLALCLLGAYVVVGGCIIKGVRSVGKVVYVTALLPYLLLAIILIRALMLEGSTEGLIFYLKPDFRKLLEVQVWIEAAIQVFYSMGPAWGGLFTMASYSRFHNNCIRDAVLLAVIGEGTSLFAGLVVFSSLGYMANQANISVAEIVSTGPGLGFVAYPEALSSLPVPQLWSCLFFLMLFTVGLDTEFTMFETVLTTIVDAWQQALEKRRTLVTVAFCVLFYLLALPNVTNGGIYVFQLFDWYTASIGLMFCAALECVVTGWIYGADRLGDDIEMMTGRRPPLIFKIMWCFVTPAILFTVLMFTLFQYKPPTYGKYTYPVSSQVFGWILALVSVIPTPVIMVRELLKRNGTFVERLVASLKPDASWGPAPREYREIYQSKQHKRRVFNVKSHCARFQRH